MISTWFEPRAVSAADSINILLYVFYVSCEFPNQMYNHTLMKTDSVVLLAILQE